MRMTKRILALVLPLSFFCSPASHAESQPSAHWLKDPDRIWTVDGSDAGSDSDFLSFSRIIRSSTTTGPVIIFNCQVNSRGTQTLGFGFQLDPENNYMDDPDRSPRILTASGILTIDGKRKAERFRYHPDSSKIVPFDRSVGRRMFNAVVKGSEIQLKFQNTTYALTVPPTDSIFTSFAKVCPVTNGGNFDMTIFDRVSETDNVTTSKD